MALHNGSTDLCENRFTCYAILYSVMVLANLPENWSTAKLTIKGISTKMLDDDHNVMTVTEPLNALVHSSLEHS